jgi:golgi apparatus membrane protein TVP38
MPADYSSTAKALALPLDSPISESPEIQSSRPPWSRRISGTSRYSTRTSRTYKSQYLRVQNKLIKTFKSLTLFQRILLVVAGIVVNVLLILFLIYNEKIFALIAPAAKRWHDVRGGWMILWLITFICAFPPLIGYSTTVSIAGFVYGFPNGWFIVSSATIAGSLASFIASRTVLSNYVHKLVGKDKRFEALALTLKHDGLKILCMIRVCPLPYSL